MIHKVVDENINWIIKETLKECDAILDYKPIIAGGFPLAALSAVRFFDTEQKFSVFKKLAFNSGKGKVPAVYDYGDIDFWFEANNPMLTSEDSKDKYFRRLLSEKIEGHNLPDLFMDSKIFGISSLKKSSNIANAYRSSNNRIIQLIKKTQQDPEQLIRGFDLDICKVAWMNGITYIDESALYAFENLEIKANNISSYYEENLQTKLFNALRAFKYAHRYKFDFDEELTKAIFQLYMEVKDLDFANIKQYQQSSYTAYGVTVQIDDEDENSFSNMVNAIVHYQPMFFDMKHFKEEYLLYFIDAGSKFPEVATRISKDKKASILGGITAINSLINPTILTPF